MGIESERRVIMIAKHTAHGLLVEDVYRVANEYTRCFGYKPSRIDETFAGFPFGEEGEFFLWQWEHLEKHLGKDVMEKVKYRDQQAVRFKTRKEVDEAYEELKKNKNIKFLTEPKDYEWNAYCVYFLDISGHMWELYCWTGKVPLGDYEKEKK